MIRGIFWFLIAVLVAIICTIVIGVVWVIKLGKPHPDAGEMVRVLWYTVFTWNFRGHGDGFW